MKIQISALFIILIVLFSQSCFSQGESAVPFLMISPFTEANGMGEVSVAVDLDNPLAPITNPAHLGMMSLRNYYSSGYDYSDWLPGFKQSDLWLKTFGFNAGVNLGKLFDILPSISYGVGYSKVYFNLGEYIVTGPNGPEPLGKHHAYESSEQVTLSAGFDYIIRGSIGFTTKQITSSLADFDVQGTGQRGVANVSSYDFGFLVEIPLVRLASEAYQKPIEIVPSLSPVFDLSFGLAKNNLGEERVIYIDEAQADPLPRYARAGIGIDLGFTLDKNEVKFAPLKFKWSVEANDILVQRYSGYYDSVSNTYIEPSWNYKDGIGDIKIGDELILGHFNDETIHKKGWEFTLAEFISFRGGRFEEAYNRGNRHFNTSGMGFRLSGLVKVWKILDPGILDEGVVSFVLTHLDFRYNISEIETGEEYEPLDKTKFWGISLSFSNQ